MDKGLYQFSLSTKRQQEFVDITGFLRQAIEDAGVTSGLAVVYCPHTTAGITITENADPDVVRDIIATLDKVFPVQGDYRHYEGNSHAHLKSSYVGAEKTIIIKDGKPLLGTWQSVFFCEFDGPRNRRVFIKVLAG